MDCVIHVTWGRIQTRQTMTLVPCVPTTVRPQVQAQRLYQIALVTLDIQGSMAALAPYVPQIHMKTFLQTHAPTAQTIPFPMKEVLTSLLVNALTTLLGPTAVYVQLVRIVHIKIRLDLKPVPTVPMTLCVFTVSVHLPLK